MPHLRKSKLKDERAIQKMVFVNRIDQESWKEDSHEILLVVKNHPDRFHFFVFTGLVQQLLVLLLLQIFVREDWLHLSRSGSGRWLLSYSLRRGG